MNSEFLIGLQRLIVAQKRLMGCIVGKNRNVNQDHYMFDAVCAIIHILKALAMVNYTLRGASNFYFDAAIEALEGMATPAPRWEPSAIQKRTVSVRND
jgi:hypothetical protein